MHVGRVHVVLFVPTRRRQHDVRIQAGRAHAEVQRDQQVQLAFRIRQGFLETSNVNVVEELVTMIQTQRAYEMNSKVITTADEMLQAANQVKS